MNQRISFLTLGVSGLAAMKSFYEDVFGWIPQKNESEQIVFFKLNDFILGLYPAAGLAEDVGVEQDGAGFKKFTLAMNYKSVAEVDHWFATLVEKGARPVKKPEQVFWGGYRGYIADPENNYWELAYNPFLEMDEEGHIVSHH